MQAVKVKDGAFKHVESELYAYPYRKREIERLRLEIQYPYDEEPDDPAVVEGKNSVRTISDPTAKMGIRLAGHAKLLHMERVADAIEEVYNNLTEHQQEFVRLKYWTKPQKLTAIGICSEIGISDRTFSRWRRIFVNEIAEKLGWD